MPKSNALTWIVREAKRLKKKYPKRFSEWKKYVAQASAIYASKHHGRSPVGKKKIGITMHKKKKAASRRTVTLVTQRTTRKIGTVKDHVSKARKMLEKKYGELQVRLLHAKNSRAAKRIHKDIVKVKSDIRKLVL